MSATQFLINSFLEPGIGNGSQALVGGGNWSATTTVSNVQTTIETSATFQFLSSSMNAAGTNHLTFQNGGVSGNETVTITGTSGIITDVTHSDSASAGNLVSLIWTTSSGSHFGTSIGMTTTTPYVLQGAGGNSSSSAGVPFNTANRFMPAMGAMGSGSVQTSSSFLTQQLVEAAGTASHFATNIITGIGSSGTGTVKFGRNGSAGNGTLAITTATTGIFLDSTHSDSCIVGDLLDTQYQATVSSGDIYSTSFSYVGTSSAMDTTSSQIVGASITGTTFFFGLGGQLTTNVPTLLRAQSYTPFAMTTSKLRTVWGVNASPGTATLVIQKNGSNGNESVAITSASTGTAVDTTHTDSFNSSDLINTTASVESNTPSPSSIGFNSDDGSFKAATGTSFGAVF